MFKLKNQLVEQSETEPFDGACLEIQSTGKSVYFHRTNEYADGANLAFR